MTPARKAAIIAQARALRDADPRRWNWSSLARSLGVNAQWLRRQIDDDFAARSSAKKLTRSNECGPPPLTKKQLAQILAERPVDTRNATQRFFGDPLPGRSALDRKRCEGHS